MLVSGTASLHTSCPVSASVHLSILHLFVPWSCSFIISMYFSFLHFHSILDYFSLSLYVLKVAFWLTCEFYMIPKINNPVYSPPVIIQKLCTSLLQPLPLHPGCRLSKF